MTSKFFNTDTDNTLGGENASDTAVSSQKAVKEYVDNKDLEDLKDVNISSPTQGQNLTYDATNKKWINTSTSATVAWGGLTGTLSDQTDLQTALNAKQNTISNLSTIESNAANGQSAYATIQGYGDVVTHNASEFYLASNPNGYTSNEGTVTSVNNVSPVNGNVTLSIPSEVTESTVSGWGFTKNTGTVTSVNNIAPVNGNVTINIPTKVSDLTNDSGFITGITSSDVTTALGYTPYNSSNPQGYTSNVGTVTSVNNIEPVDGNVTVPISSDVTMTYDSSTYNLTFGRSE